MGMCAKKITAKRELKRIASRQGTKFLYKFAYDVEYWELLLVIYTYDGDPDYGIGDYVARVKSNRRTNLTMQNFIRDRIAEGCLVVANSVKKSRKTLTLSKELREELENHLSWIVAATTSISTTPIPSALRSNRRH